MSEIFTTSTTSNLLYYSLFLIIFVTIIYHYRTFLPELEQSIGDPSLLRKLFENRKDSLKHKYGRFCINKPKSEHIITEHRKYFIVIIFIFI